MKIMLICQSKLDDSIPDGQFLIEGFGKLFRLDQKEMELVLTLFT